MDKEGYRIYLTDREKPIPEEKIVPAISMIERFEKFVEKVGRTLESATSMDVRNFSKMLIEEETNTYDNYLALSRYGYFIQNFDLYLAVLELLDGAEVLDVLRERIGEVAGKGKSDEIFKDIDNPLGLPSTEKPKVAKAVLDQMEKLLTPEDCRKALVDTAHGIPKEWYKEEREKFLKAKDIDEYLANKRAEIIANLEKHRDEGRLFFNQMITDDVIEYVKNRPDVMTGMRNGDKIIHTKIPYMAKEYLDEKDEKKKRYYACHCAWARETIMNNELEIPATFCNCSGGFTVQPWEMALDQPLDVEMIKSVLKGDMECTFAIQLPRNVIEKVEG
ncbi:MAG: hypothetical protein EAX81_03240 [Candidatus Thorarchaeota archaeon]|nr:hypothetical protein [Candidatus Thorarchaeota archaeon]